MFSSLSSYEPAYTKCMCMYVCKHCLLFICRASLKVRAFYECVQERIIAKIFKNPIRERMVIGRAFSLTLKLYS
jgi:hypothetical protein